jgi:KaiC/GvpD/RAD55 family RecA-like ATPase
VTTDFAGYEEIKARHTNGHTSREPKHTEPEDATSWKEPDPEYVRQKLSLADWLTRDIAMPDFIMGEVLSTTSRILVVGPTGLGKTNFGMAIAIAVAEGQRFLHWRGGQGPRRVLYIDGEMPERLMRSRLEDAVRRLSRAPDTLFTLSREDFPVMPPLDTESGQHFVDRVIEIIGGVDVAMFDNIQSLTISPLKEEEGWRLISPWTRELTRRKVGQIWFHHTGHNESHSYGDKQREWQMDIVALMERIERPEADIAFRLTFPKSRQRTPENRSDYEPCIITLQNDEWLSERGEKIQRGSKRTAKDRALELLTDALARGQGQIPPADEHIPPDTLCLNEALWRKIVNAGSISEGSTESTERIFRRIAKDLLNNGWIGRWSGWVWVIRR